MNAREKTLAIAVAGIVGVIGAAVGIQYFIAKPLKEMDKRIIASRGRLEKMNTERRNYFAAEDRVKAFARQAFADTVDEASARSGELLTKQIIQAGLREANFTRLPVGPRKMRGASEIGWNVQGDGPLGNVVNLLFLLQHAPNLQRVENVTLSNGDAPGLVRVRFRCLTLVIDPAPEVERKPLEPKLTLASSERKRLEMIVERDILRPYIKRLPQPVKGKGGDGSAPGAIPKPPGPETLRVVSLSEWQGQPEIHIRDTVREKTLRYKPGDPLLGGVVEMVDYRPLQRPGSIGLQSFSRLILRKGDEFWAVEHGQTLADLRKLEPGQLPPQLQAAAAK